MSLTDYIVPCCAYITDVRTYGDGETGTPTLVSSPTAVNDVDFTSIVQRQITFEQEESEFEIQLDILEDNICETVDSDDKIFVLRFLEDLSDGKICEDNSGDDLEDVEINILHDDGKNVCFGFLVFFYHKVFSTI